jgi:hypothetical protein
MESKVLKEKSCVYIIPPCQVFQKEGCPVFESFSEEYSQLLYQALYLNFYDLFSAEVRFNTVYVLPQRDSDYITEDMKESGNNFYFVDTLDYHAVINKLKEKLFQRYSNNMLVFSNAIGITAKMLETAFNLLNYEDNYLVIGRAVSDAITYVGFNSFQAGIENLNNNGNIDFNETLKSICAVNSNIHIFNGGQVIKNLDDFKLLYKALSSKESFAFCSQKIHELFTNIFIEYKDLL